MRIIFDTLILIFGLIGVLFLLGLFVFREQLNRVIRYFQIWLKDDEKREKQRLQLELAAKQAKEEEEMREAAARERAEAEIQQNL